MVRIKRANGQWDDLTGAVAVPERFQRSDGSHMTPDEIGAASAVDVDFVRSKRPAAAGPATRAEIAIAKAEQAWEAVHRLGTQTAAAAELGLTQAGVQARLDRYMTSHGIKGPRPGLLTNDQISASHQRKPVQILNRELIVRPPKRRRLTDGPGHKFAAVYDPLEAAAIADTQGPDPLPEPKTAGSRPAGRQVQAPVPGDLQPDPATAPAGDLHPLLGSLLDWLVANRSELTPERADLWHEAWVTSRELVRP